MHGCRVRVYDNDKYIVPVVLEPSVEVALAAVKESDEMNAMGKEGGVSDLFYHPILLFVDRPCFIICHVPPAYCLSPSRAVMHSLPVILYFPLATAVYMPLYFFTLTIATPTVPPLLNPISKLPVVKIAACTCRTISCTLV
jgi:hypothetical protein